MEVFRLNLVFVVYTTLLQLMHANFGYIKELLKAKNYGPSYRINI